MVKSTKDMLNSRFDMKDMGLAEVILGIKIVRRPDGLALSQSHYIDKILNKFNKDDVRVAKTPLDVNAHLAKHRGPSNSQIEYARVIGSLMYLMISTRPDLACAISKLSKYTSNPSDEHWKAIIRVMRYLRYTRNYGLCYSRYPPVLEGYTDANWISYCKDLKFGWQKSRAITLKQQKDDVTMTIPSGATTGGEPLSHVKYTRAKVILCYQIAVMAGFAYGYSQTFVGGLLNMPNFVVMLLGKKGYRKAVKAVVSNFCSYVNAYMLMCSASIPFGTTIGLISGRFLHFAWGPKGRMRLGAAWVLAAASLAALPYPHGLSLPLFFLVIGLGIGIIIEAVPLLYKQISREDVHPRIGTVFNLAYYLGIVSALLVNYLISRYWPLGWRVTFASVAFPAFMLILASIFLKQTVVNGPEESCTVLLRHHKDVFLSKTGFLLLAQFMGSSQLVFYGPMILESLNFGSYQQFLTPLIGSSIGSLAVAIVMLFVAPRNLRRPTFLISCVLICISQFCMWVLFHFWGSREHHFKSSIVSTIGGVLLILIYVSYFVIDGPYGWTRKEYPKVVQGIGNTLETAVMRFVIGLMNLSVPFFICALKKWAFLYLALLGFGYCLIAYRFVHDR